MFKDQTIKRRVMARVERAIARKQAEFDKECARIDKETDEKLEAMRQEALRVELARGSSKATAADRIVDELSKAIGV